MRRDAQALKLYEQGLSTADIAHRLGVARPSAARDGLERANQIPAGVTATKRLLDLGPGDCRWPIGNGPYLFCGPPKAELGSYCAFHAALATQPAADRPHFRPETTPGSIADAAVKAA